MKITEKWGGKTYEYRKEILKSNAVRIIQLYFKQIMDYSQ